MSKMVYICSCGKVFDIDDVNSVEEHLSLNKSHSITEAVVHEDNNGLPSSIPMKSDDGSVYTVEMSNNGAMKTSSESGKGAYMPAPVVCGITSKGRSYSEVRTKSYTSVGSIVFPGTKIGEPTSIKAVAYSNDGRGMDIRVFDKTNNIVLCETKDFRFKNSTIINLGSPDNASESQAIWELQVRRNKSAKRSTKVRVSYFMVEF